MIVPRKHWTLSLAAGLVLLSCVEKEEGGRTATKPPVQSVSVESLIQPPSSPPADAGSNTGAQAPASSESVGATVPPEDPEDFDSSSEMGDLSRMLQYFVYKNDRMPRDLNEFYSAVKIAPPRLPSGGRLEIDDGNRTIVYVPPKPR